MTSAQGLWFFGVGLVFGLLTLKHRRLFGGDGSENPIVWVMMSCALWPLMILVPAIALAGRLTRRWWR